MPGISLMTHSLRRLFQRLSSSAGARRAVRRKHTGTRIAGSSLERLEPRLVCAMLYGDFDRNGVQDLAIGVPGDIVNGQPAGAVQIVYSTLAGALTDTGNQRWSQATQGIADNPENGDRFGAALAAGDFDNNGHLDLVIGAPGEDLEAYRADGRTSGRIVDAGAVHVIYGASRRLSATGSQLWTQNSPGLEEAEAYDEFGAVLTAGDFDGDGYDDLAIGVPNENIGELQDAGAVHILYGSSDGLTSSRSRFVTMNQVTGEVNERYGFFGAALAAGDLDGETGDELAIGIPGSDVGGAPDAGQVAVLRSARQTSPLPSLLAYRQLPHESSDDVGPEAWDMFGSSLAIGDFDGVGPGELAVGAPGEDLEEWRFTDAGPSLVKLIRDVGAVTIFSAPTSPDLAGALLDPVGRHWRRDTPGVVGEPERDAYFGWSLAVGEYSADGRDDLVVGVPGADHYPFGEAAGLAVRDVGEVHVLFGGAGGVTSVGDLRLHLGPDSLAEFPYSRTYFGSSLATGRSGLAIGAPSANVGGDRAGAAHVVYRASGGGFRTDNDFQLTQDYRSLLGTADEGDLFGGEIPEVFRNTTPQLATDPAATRSLYLHFTGGTVDDRVTEGFMLDSYPEMNRTERAMIRDAWATAVEDFAPFQVNVTTVQPTSGLTNSVYIGSRWPGRTDIASGVALANYADRNIPVYVFSDMIVQRDGGPASGANFALQIGTTISHEAGHGYGLDHKSELDANGNVLREYSSGGDDWTPIMGANRSEDRTVWTQAVIDRASGELFVDHDDDPSTPRVESDRIGVAAGDQGNDIQVLTRELGRRPDDHGATPSTAFPLGRLVGPRLAVGRIESVTDQDAFRFNLASPATVGIRLSVNDVAPNLPASLYLRSTNIAAPDVYFSNPADRLDAEMVVRLDAGDYLAVVSADQGLDGNVGQYTLFFEVLPLQIDHRTAGEGATAELQPSNSVPTLTLSRSPGPKHAPDAFQNSPASAPAAGEAPTVGEARAAGEAPPLLTASREHPEDDAIPALLEELAPLRHRFFRKHRGA